jgi:DNA-binding transcriptional LysR family regulator
MRRIPAVNIHAVDLNLLHAFDAILRDRSVTAAAARVGLTQPAMSNALARLRVLFGDPLFVRTPRGMHPTPYAQSIAEPVRHALGLIEATLNQAGEFVPAQSDRTFRVHMSDIGEMVFLPPLLERLQREARKVKLETRSVREADLPEALASGEIDLAIGFLPGLRAPVRGEHVFTDPYVCLMRADHPAAGARLTRRQYLEASHALVSSAGSGHRVIEEAMLAAGMHRKIALRVPHFTVVPMILERTDLVVTVPSRVARIFEGMGRLRSLPAPVAIPRAAVKVHWHDRFGGDPGNRWLRDLLVALHADRPQGSNLRVRRQADAAGAWRH